MLFRKLTLFLVLTICFHALFAEVFEFKYRKDDMYKLKTEVDEDIYYNGVFSGSANYLNKISVFIEDVKGKKGSLKGIFRTFKQVREGIYLYKEEEEDYSSFFVRDEHGKYEMSNDYLMPLMRDVPLFPAYDIKPGDEWSAKGIEVHDFTEFGVQKPVLAPININYTYLRDEKRDGMNCAVFQINYAVYYLYNGPTPKANDYPVKIMGGAEQEHFWNREAGRPYYYSDDFDIYYIMKSGLVIEFLGRSEGLVTESKKWDKKKATDDIKKEIEDKKIEDTTVKEDDEGIVITLENIQFKPESDVLMPSEQAKLKKIAEILKRYPDRDLFIAGHTALAGTSSGRQALSENRARSVAEFLLMLGVRREDQITYKGFGARLPLADNSTEEGRRKNRRVEIKILEN
ncbi:MAG: OmpA family protein [Spirochaetales bacterium]|nr:OmpA family protein [Spirochaetales bacterium]